MSPRRAVLALTCLALCACPRPRLDFGKDGEAKSPEDLLARVAVAEASVLAVKGDARLGIDAPQGKGSVTLFLGVQHPALMHIEQLDFFGRPQGVLVTDGEAFGLYDAQAGTFYSGPASPANLGRFLPIVLPPRELAAILLGRVPRIPHDAAQMRVDEALGVYVLELQRGSVRQTLHVKPPSWRVVKSRVEGANAYALDFDDLDAIGLVTLARKVTLGAPLAKATVELTYKDITVNEPPDLTLFDLSGPEGIPVVEVDAAGKPRDAAESPPAAPLSTP